MIPLQNVTSAVKTGRKSQNKQPSQRRGRPPETQLTPERQVLISVNGVYLKDEGRSPPELFTGGFWEEAGSPRVLNQNQNISLGPTRG